MKKLSRAKNTMRNTLWGAIYRVATLIGPFAIKTIIIKELGQEYNGLSTLFTSVLTVLNLANLGFNSSLVFTMYKAIAEDDKPALCAMLKFYRKVYRIVGLVILGMGLAVMPFLPWLVKNECPPDVNLYVLFAIYLSESVLDYLMFAYNNATFTAFQRNDVTLKISTVRYVVQYTLQAAVLLIFSNYYAYIILLPLMVIPNNVAVYLAARKHYPDIVCQGELDPVTKKDIYKRVGTLFGHKLGNTFLVSIDSIIISSFLGLTALSLYSNYYYILTAVNGLVEIVTNGSLSGIRYIFHLPHKRNSHTGMIVRRIGNSRLFPLPTAEHLCGSALTGDRPGFFQPFPDCFGQAVALLMCRSRQNRPFRMPAVFRKFEIAFRRVFQILILSLMDEAALIERTETQLKIAVCAIGDAVSVLLDLLPLDYGK